MKFIVRKNFDKAYAKLDAKLKNKVDATLQIFKANPTDAFLENHPLKGSLLGKRSIKVTGDIRIIFEQIDNYVVVHLLAVGTHNQVY